MTTESQEDRLMKSRQAIRERDISKRNLAKIKGVLISHYWAYPETRKKYESNPLLHEFCDQAIFPELVYSEKPKNWLDEDAELSFHYIGPTKSLSNNNGKINIYDQRDLSYCLRLECLTLENPLGRLSLRLSFGQDIWEFRANCDLDISDLYEGRRWNDQIGNLARWKNELRYLEGLKERLSH